MVLKPAIGSFGSVGRCRVLLEYEITEKKKKKKNAEKSQKERVKRDIYRSIHFLSVNIKPMGFSALKQV